MVKANDIKLENNVERILEAITLGKVLNPPSRFKHPCSICNKNCLSNQKHLPCFHCTKSFHIKCNGTTLEQYEFHQNNQNKKWYCLDCTVRYRHSIIPFTCSSVSKLININSSDNMEFCNFQPCLEIIHETSAFEKYSLPDTNFDLPNLVNSKYHTVEQCQQLKIESNFNIFHSNVNRLESKFDGLHTFISGSKSSFDIIAITETSESSEHSFSSTIKIDEYDLFHTPTSSSKGGVALYVNEAFDSFERLELKAQTPEFECVWIEIKNSRSRNIVCGCIYRHPRNDMSNFFEYMESSLKKLNDENKEIYFCGDFNINLLQIETENNSTAFYNQLTSHGILPYIIHPTRVVEGQTPSLIDNIFSNNVNENVISGNIYLTLSEHFSQFASIIRDKIDIKKVNMTGRNWKGFSDDLYRDDVSIQNWNFESRDANYLMADFIWKLTGTADRHAPIKKLSPKEVKRRLNPWITPEIIKLIRVRDRLFTQKKRDPDNLLVKQAYNQARNRVQRNIQKAKKEYHKSYFETHSTNIKKTWEGIKKLSMLKNQQIFQ